MTSERSVRGKRNCEFYVGSLGPLVQSCPRDAMPYLNVWHDCVSGLDDAFSSTLNIHLQWVKRCKDKKTFQLKANRPVANRCIGYNLLPLSHGNPPFPYQWTSSNVLSWTPREQTDWVTDMTENITFPRTTYSYNNAFSDFDAKKFSHCNRVLFLTELGRNGTQYMYYAIFVHISKYSANKCRVCVKWTNSKNWYFSMQSLVIFLIVSYCRTNHRANHGRSDNRIHLYVAQIHD